MPRFVLGGLMLVGVKTGFKPVFYWVAGTRLEGAKGRNLHRQRSQHSQWIEVLYKVRLFKNKIIKIYSYPEYLKN